MEVAIPESLSTEANSRLVNWLPWSELKLSGRFIALEGFSEGVRAKAGIEGVGEPAGEHPAGGPVHDRHQVQEALLEAGARRSLSSSRAKRSRSSANRRRSFSSSSFLFVSAIVAQRAIGALYGASM